MLRILLWKLGFEWANLKRIVWPNDEHKIYYFAFGANLSPDILKERGMTIFHTYDFVLQGAALQFTQSGFYKDHGFASADETEGDQVYGKMYQIRQSDAARMDFYEGVPFIKAHDKVYNEHEGSAFYYYRARNQTQNLKPTQQYLDYITTAYREMECVPKDYLADMEAIETLDKLDPQTRTGKFIDDIDRWPNVLHPFLVRYEGVCQRTVETFWNSSLLTWMIKS